MKIELIQPFINSADAVLAEVLQCQTRIGDVNMEEEAYRRKGVAAEVEIKGDIEGRVIFDMDPSTALNVAGYLAGGGDVEHSEGLVEETILEIANMVIGNAITALNDGGFQFKIAPPSLLTAERGLTTNEDTEALVMCFDTTRGSLYMNIALHYNRRRKTERAAVVAD